MFQFDEGFVTSLKHLSAHEWKHAVQVAMDVQRDHRSLSLHVEPIHAARDNHLYSVRVNDNLRIIAVERGECLIPLYVDFHDAAYRWAKGRRAILDAQTNVITIQHIAENVGQSVPFAPRPLPGIYDNYEDAYLVSLGVPNGLLPTLRHIRTDDDLINILDDLTGEYVGHLLDLASGKLSAPSALVASAAPLLIVEAMPVSVPVVVVAGEPASEVSEVTETPADMRRYEPLRLFDVDDADLRRMLAAPTQEAWIAFLHPSQRGVATRCYRGPAQITGGAGTGKTVVAMHRARHLARQGRKVFLTSYTHNARAVLERGIRFIADADELRRITVQTVHAMALSIVQRVEPVQPPQAGEVVALIAGFSARSGVDASLAEAEWRLVIQALGITAWEDYRDARRTGRGARLSVADRERLWEGVIVPLDAAMKARGVLDWADICQWARQFVEAGTVPSPFNAVIVDETQDLGPQELRLLAALAGDEDDSLTLVGDAGQRIYPNRTRLSDLGIDVRGRGRVLTLNYRTTREIHAFAERLSGNAPEDFDGGRGRRGGVHSLFTGPDPTLHGFADATAQYTALAEEIARRETAGMPFEEMVVLTPTNAIVQATQAALVRANIPCHELSQRHRTPSGCVPVTTIHGAKGMEFRVVFVVGASDKVFTHLLSDDAEERAVTLEQQRNLLYVAVTRAREELIVYWPGTPNRFLPIREVGEASEVGEAAGVQAVGA